MIKNNITLKDVAKFAGVSLGTASKVVNNIYVKAETKTRVEKVIKELNYTPNAIARSLKVKYTKTIGVIISDISSPIVSKIVTGIQDIGNMAGYSVMLYDTKMRQADEIKAINLYNNKMVDGIIFTSNTITEPIADLLKKVGIPTVLVATKDESGYFSSVTIDNEKAAYTAVKHLCELGHKKIAMLSGKVDDPNAGIPRVIGYKKALAEFDINYNESYLYYGNYRFEDGYIGMKNLLTIDKTITAVFSASDEMAMGAIKALHNVGKRIPKDISIIGFDGTEMINYTVPTLSTIEQPLYDFGAIGMKILLEQIKNSNHKENIIVDFKLVENGSCFLIEENI